MELLRIAVHTLFAYLCLLGLLRLSGKWTIRHGTTFDFVLALVIGDLIDDALWAEVPLSQFVVAASTLVLTKLMAAALTRAATPWLRSDSIREDR